MEVHRTSIEEPALSEAEGISLQEVGGDGEILRLRLRMTSTGKLCCTCSDDQRRTMEQDVRPGYGDVRLTSGYRAIGPVGWRGSSG
ncbi:MAG: hypothetical protein ACR2GR_07695 [Rhodothermales bacterium]